MYAPTRSPAARSSCRDHQRRRRLAVRPDDVHRAGSAACGSPSVCEQRAHPPEPEAPRARARALSSQPTFVIMFSQEAGRTMCPEGRARAGTARASRARRSTTSAGAFATKRSFASIPSARAISLRSRARSASTSPCRLPPLGLDDGVEDPPLLVRAELDLHAAPAERRWAASWTRSSARRVRRVGVVRLGPRPRRSAAPAGRATATRSPRSRAASPGAAARAGARARRAPSRSASSSPS